MSLQDEYVARVKEELTALGYVVLKDASYKKAQERQRIAEVRREDAERKYQDQREWMDRSVFPWERHLVHRVDHLGGLAARLGATKEDFVGPPCTCDLAACVALRTPTDNASTT